MRAGMDEAWVTCADPDRSDGGGARPGWRARTSVLRALREPVTFIVGRGRGRL